MPEFFVPSAYQWLVFIHVLLFVMWLGGDIGVFILGQNFRRRREYTLDQRVALLKLLVKVDMWPRTAWALMIPITISMLGSGGYWDVPLWGTAIAWAVGGFWLWLMWDAHAHDQTPRAARNRKIESYLQYGLTVFYLALGIISLIKGVPLETTWLALKALMFGFIFLTAIMIDVSYKPVGPQLMKLLDEGSSDETELPLLKTMNRTRVWVWTIYLLLLGTAFLGNVKPI